MGILEQKWVLSDVAFNLSYLGGVQQGKSTTTTMSSGELAALIARISALQKERGQLKSRLSDQQSVWRKKNVWFKIKEGAFVHWGEIQVRKA